MEISFYISRYYEGDLEIECKHVHYAFDDRFNFDHVPAAELINRMAEIQEHCESEGIIPRFEVV